MNSLLSQKYSENNVRSWTDSKFPSNLRTRCAESVKMYTTTIHACSFTMNTTPLSVRNHYQSSDLHTLLSSLIIMILFNVYLTKVYHVRNILTFVNFWTEATNLATFVEIREILLTLPPMQSMLDLDNLISDIRTVETLGDGNSASE